MEIAEKRLVALDNLESEVDGLQVTLSGALQSQREASLANQPKPLSDSTVDLVAAVKLTLLYVQNKLSPDDIGGHESELERLIAELLSLRSRDRTELSEMKKENEMLRTESITSSAELLSIQRSSCALKDELKDLISAECIMLRHELFEIRNLLQMYKKRMTMAVDQARLALCAMSKFQSDFDARLARKDARIAYLRGDLARSKEDYASSSKENSGLRRHLDISNSAMNELEHLVENIESEREASHGLISRLVDFKETMDVISSNDEHPSLEGCPSCVDPLALMTKQLEAEMRRNNELEGECMRLKDELNMMVTKYVKHSVDDAGATRLAGSVLSLNEKLEQLQQQNEILQNELKLCQIGKCSPHILKVF